MKKFFSYVWDSVLGIATIVLFFACLFFIVVLLCGGIVTALVVLIEFIKLITGEII